MSKILFSINSVPYSSYRIVFFFCMVKSRSNLTENIQIPRENTRVFQASYVLFFHVFTRENIENTSVLVYGKGLIWVKYEIFS